MRGERGQKEKKRREGGGGGKKMKFPGQSVLSGEEVAFATTRGWPRAARLSPIPSRRYGHALCHPTPFSLLFRGLWLVGPSRKHTMRASYVHTHAVYYTRCCHAALSPVTAFAACDELAVRDFLKASRLRHTRCESEKNSGDPLVSSVDRHLLCSFFDEGGNETETSSLAWGGVGWGEIRKASNVSRSDFTALQTALFVESRD